MLKHLPPKTISEVKEHIESHPEKGLATCVSCVEFIGGICRKYENNKSNPSLNDFDWCSAYLMSVRP